MQTLTEKIARLEERKKAIAAQQRALLAKQAEVNRKRRTRAKIIIGGLLIGLAKHDDELADYMRSAIAQKITGPELALLAEIYPELAAAVQAKNPA